jgi:hypothetical protein
MYLSCTICFLNIRNIFTRLVRAGVTNVDIKFVLLDPVNFLLIKTPQTFNPSESNLTFSQNMIKFLWYSTVIYRMCVYEIHICSTSTVLVSNFVTHVGRITDRSHYHRCCSQGYHQVVSFLRTSASLGLISFTMPQSQQTYSALSTTNFSTPVVFAEVVDSQWPPARVPIYLRTWRWIVLNWEWLSKLELKVCSK